MRLGLSLCLLIPFLMGSSCDQGIKFNPDFHIGDSTGGQIVSETGREISCFDPEFDRFACMGEEKIKELRTILASARMPRNSKEMETVDSSIFKIDKVLKRMRK